MVLSTGPKVAVDTTIKSKITIDSDQKLANNLASNKLQPELIYSTRRPVPLERLKVTRKSLQQWLRKRSSLWR
ncbi:hypothetical protein, partial [Staphylococcus aureus]|uniref:hypothetical protein n=1 Tax=Staphylococcus aureus TaxID=1280 RepID=UPI0038B33814